MTLAPLDPARTEVRASGTPVRERVLGFLGRHFATVVGSLAILYLLVPIGVIVALSLNKPAGRYNYSWNEFSTYNWTHMCGPYGLCDSVVLSLKIAGLSALAATAIGVLAAYALTRFRFRARGAVNLLVLMPMAMPEVVLGASLLTLFVNMQMSLGFTTILLAHIMFCISFVVVTVKARLAMLDPGLDEAAMDLYATPWRAFRKVTLPLATPGIVAGAVLAFALSFDDFIITNFNSGNSVTFPMYVWGAARRGVPAQVNVVATLMFLIVLTLALTVSIAAARRSRRNAA